MLVGGLTAMTVAIGALFWQLLVRPDVFLSVWSDKGVTDSQWFEHHPGALIALRWTLGVVVFLLGFLTGLALTFLTGTS